MTLKNIPFSEYETGALALIDEDTCPPHMLGDYVRRNENLRAGKKLCERCDGTGNELYSMYRKCQDCIGSGEQNEQNE